MPYRYLDDIAIADAAFEAWGDTIEDMFISAADAAMNVMVEDLATIASKRQRIIDIKETSLDMLLFQFLQEVLFYKDAEQLLLRVKQLEINQREKAFFLKAQTSGEKLNSKKHDLVVDVKAVTLHKFQVKKVDEGWKTVVVLDI